MYEFSYVLVQFSILRNGSQVPQTNNMFHWKIVTVALTTTEILYLRNDLFYPLNQQQHFQRELIDIHPVCGT